MEEAILEIIAAIKGGTKELDAAWLDRLLRRHNRATHDGMRRVAKRRMLPYYLFVKANDRERWESWDVDPKTEQTLLRLLKLKPRRTASGVATITVITKPWPCSSDCLYCPNDVRMPKSYLSDEPACQRAERNFFDPYLQVRSRLVALSEMGHVTDKVELIVLGGTWSDYPEAYQYWFVSELFRAVSDFGSPIMTGEHPEERDRRYRACGHTYDKDELVRRTASLQGLVNQGSYTYNDAIRQIGARDEWQQSARWQRASLEDLQREHLRNEQAAHRVVGLTIETRPDLITPQTARAMRRLGCTKIQMGIQSLDQHILERNHRRVSVEQIAEAFAALRLAGFKIQVHFMANLVGATPQGDKQDYLKLVSDERFLPDEVKLYPCCLVESARLKTCYEQGAWQPYSEDELIDLLVADTIATPAYTRISRMIRDISATDIMAGNKKTNLRQMVENQIVKRGHAVQEIRMREVATTDVDPSSLSLENLRYHTTVSEEHFLQWVTNENRIAAFLRLSLPKGTRVAMIREVHVYGRVAALGLSEHGGAQHAGLGKGMIEAACLLAHDEGYAAIDVISSVGTRAYYRKLGFYDTDLYQRKDLVDQVSCHA